MLALASSAAAAPAKYVHIEVTENIGGPDGEAFSASGPAVDAGLVCGSGIVNDTDYTPGHEAGIFTFFQAAKTFTCDEGGTFDVELRVRLNTITRQTSATWSVVGGSGDYEFLRASGLLVGTPDVPGETILDVYDGIVR